MADKADKKMGEENLDVVAALMDVQTAEEGLLVASANFDMLTTACENIEAGVVLADGIAAKGDETSAVIVARETLRQNLKVLGQEHILGKVITPANESITAATEGIGDMLKNAWAKTKEIAMKIWKWIVDLVSKVGHFLASLVGKGDTTYERLVKLVKKHKSAKTTNLDGQEFSESVQKALNKKFALLSIEKDVSGSAVITGIESITKALEHAEDVKGDLLKTELPFVDIENMMKYASAFGKDASKTDVKDVDAVINVLKKIVVPTTPIAKGFALDVETAKNYGNVKSLDLLDAAETAAGDVEGAVVIVTGGTTSKVLCIAICTTTEAIDAIDEIDKLSGDDKKVSKVFALASKIINGIKVVEFSVTPESSEYDDNYKDITPLEFSEIESIKDAIKDADKKATKIVKNFGDKISKEKREVEKLLKTTMKDIGKDASPISDKIKSILSKVVSNNTKIAKAKAAGITASAKELLTSPVYDYCAESAKLYKKD